MGRFILGAAALLLLATACIHALGLPMASRWGEGLGPPRASRDLRVVGARLGELGRCRVAWGVTAWRGRAWLGAAALATLIPIYGAVGVLYIDPSFFGGQMLAGSVLLAAAGLFLCGADFGRRHDPGEAHGQPRQANLPSRDLDKTQAFYEALGFSVGFKDDGWMIMRRGELELEFFRSPSWTRVRAVSQRACAWTIWMRCSRTSRKPACPTIAGPCPAWMSRSSCRLGLRMFHVVDLDGSLLRCIDNSTTSGG